MSRHKTQNSKNNQSKLNVPHYEYEVFYAALISFRKELKSNAPYNGRRRVTLSDVITAVQTHKRVYGGGFEQFSRVGYMKQLSRWLRLGVFPGFALTSGCGIVFLDDMSQAVRTKRWVDVVSSRYTPVTAKKTSLNASSDDQKANQLVTKTKRNVKQVINRLPVPSRLAA